MKINKKQSNRKNKNAIKRTLKPTSKGKMQFFKQRENNFQNIPKINYKQKSNNCRYKNLPKLLGNYFIKIIPQAASELIKKKKSLTVTDIKNACKKCKATCKLLQTFLKNTKIEYPLNYIDGIANYLALSENPDQMKGSYILQNYVKNHLDVYLKNNDQ